MMSFCRTVIVTGANRGIGLEFIKQISKLANGPEIIFATVRNPDSATDLSSLQKSDSRINIIKMDITDDQSIKNARDQVKKKLEECKTPLNLLINNAGYMDRANFDDITRESLLKQFDINAAGLFVVCQAFLPLLEAAAKQGGGQPNSVRKAAIVTMTSGAGSIAENTGGSKNGSMAYRISKAAANQVVKTLSVDLASEGILCCCFCPGWVKTELGGPNATITAEESVTALLETIKNLNETHHGKYMRRQGNEILW